MSKTAKRHHFLAVLFGGTGSLVDRLKEIDATLSPEARAWIHGAGLAFDPLPTQNHRTFMGSDRDAFRADWASIGDDIRAAMLRLDVGDLDGPEEAEADGWHTPRGRAPIWKRGSEAARRRTAGTR